MRVGRCCCDVGCCANTGDFSDTFDDLYDSDDLTFPFVFPRGYYSLLGETESIPGTLRGHSTVKIVSLVRCQTIPPWPVSGVIVLRATFSIEGDLSFQLDGASIGISNGRTDFGPAEGCLSANIGCGIEYFQSPEHPFIRVSDGGQSLADPNLVVVEFDSESLNEVELQIEITRIIDDTYQRRYIFQGDMIYERQSRYEIFGQQINWDIENSSESTPNVGVSELTFAKTF